MNEVRRVALTVLIVSAALSSCGPKHVRTPEPPPGQDLVVLLADRDSNTVGAAVVSNGAGAVDLDKERESTKVIANQMPTPATPLDSAEIDRLFGDVLAALPPPPRHFTLFFRFESDELTDESRALVPGVLSAVKALPVPEVLVVGHTDTMGNSASNIVLGMKRANMVRALLVEAGLDASLIEVTSHGEADLLVRTPDETPEPRNRRVEITVR